MFVASYSGLSSVRQQNDGAGGARPVYDRKDGPRGCNYRLLCTQIMILHDEAESLAIPGQSSGLSPGRAPSCIIRHESRERRDVGLCERFPAQHSPTAELELESLFLNSAWK